MNMLSVNNSNPKMSLLSSRIAAETKACKIVNEDSCGLYRGEKLSALAIADGVGSSADCHVSSRLAVETFLRVAQERNEACKEISEMDVKVFWETVAMEIVKHYRNHESSYQSHAGPLQTTLLTIVECEDRYIVSYIGNGIVWIIRGDFWEFLDRRWPWSLTDLSVGHTLLDENGREALYGVLGNTGMTGSLRLCTLNKDSHCGEIFLLTTDGVSSQDHARVGYDSNNRLWTEVNPHIENMVRQHLPSYLERASLEEDKDPHMLAHMVRSFLDGELFDDDATIAVLVSGPVIEYKNKRKQSSSQNENYARP